MRFTSASLVVATLVSCSQPGTVPDSSSVDADADLLVDAAQNSSDAERDTETSVDADAEGDVVIPGTLGPADRSAALLRPVDSAWPAPLAVLLHGYGPSEESYAFLVGLGERLRNAGFFVIIPDGTQNSSGYRFWNTGPLCCDFDHSGVDDTAYLRGLVEEAIEGAPIDRDRVFMFGHSNGGFMAYRMACEASDLLTAIVSLAGTDPSDDGACSLSRAVSVVHVHGDADTSVPFDGGPLPINGEIALGAEETVRRWAGIGGCSLDATTLLGERDYEATLPGTETVLSAYNEECLGSAAFELWRIRGGGHRPEFTDAFHADLANWLLNHSSEL